MTDASERAVVFECRGERLVGVLTAAATPGDVGVLIVVGGPQYRVGSHRQFVLLARRLASEGVPAMRFDCRGMGDSTGPVQSFEDEDPDIGAAIDAMARECPHVDKLVLWGLCDAASAALSYWHGTRDPRIAGLVLVNPWVRSDASIARTRVRHYYAKRLLERGFWTKLLRGGVNVRDAAGGLRRGVSALLARGGSDRAGGGSAFTFQDRMAAGLRAFPGPVLLMLSGRDLTAKEFLDCASTNPRWAGLLDRSNVTRVDVPDADHTFSAARLRGQAEAATLAWLSHSFPVGPG